MIYNTLIIIPTVGRHDSHIQRISRVFKYFIERLVAFTYFRRHYIDCNPIIHWDTPFLRYLYSFFFYNRNNRLYKNENTLLCCCYMIYCLIFCHYDDEDDNIQHI